MRLLLLVLAFVLPGVAFAHQAPTTIVLVDVSPSTVSLELQLPVPELELAFGNDIGKDPEHLVARFGAQLKEYLLAHIHVYRQRELPWQAAVDELHMAKGYYPENGLPYWELIASVAITPPAGVSTRRFTLDYDVIMHQVINHAAFVSVRNDWEAGNTGGNAADAGVIRWDGRDNVIHPLNINLAEGSWFNGARHMLAEGMEHIKTGTDHLLFLLVLLLPSMLLVKNKRWAAFGGVKYSAFRLFKIVSAFTVGHSLTLIAGTLGWVHIASQPVEICIAASILVSAVHAIVPLFYGREIYVAGAFGLVHGLAFASVLSALHLSGGPLVLTLLAFNTGIECMQLLIVLLLMPWLILLSTTRVYTLFRVVLALLAAAAAIGWLTERISGHDNIISRFMQSEWLVHKGIIVFFALLCVTLYTICRNRKADVQESVA
ncbi:MAG: HupE/UreJ family protein [Flavihumibacter sp.]